MRWLSVIGLNGLRPSGPARFDPDDFTRECVMVEAQVRSGMRQVLSVGVLALGVVAVLT